MGNAPGDLAYQSIEGLASVTAAGAVNIARDVAVTGPVASVYTYTLSRELPAAQAVILATLGAASGSLFKSHVSNLVKTISTFNAAGAATDRDHDTMFLRVLG